MSSRKLIAIGVSTLSIGAAVLLFHPGSAQAVLYNASGVLGQTNFTSSTTTTTQSGMNYSLGSVLDLIHHRLFVDDCNNNRVLVFLLDATNNVSGTSAAYVLGQTNFTSSTATTTQSGFGHAGGCPQGLAYDAVNDRLFAADSSNHRVLAFNVSAGTIANGENASYVLGQPNFTSSTATTTQSGLSFPQGLAYDAATNRLFVGEFFNNRIMVFNVATSTIANGENALNVLGQTNFTSSTATTTQSGLNNSEGLAYDGSSSRLFVAEASNNRVLIFNVASGTIANGENASYVLGQANFTSSTATSTQSGLDFPIGFAYDATNNRLFIGDDNNNRMMVFNVATSTIANGENAMNVFGQTNFTSSTATTTQSGFNDPEGDLAYDPVNHHLFVPDSSNNRVLQFNFISITTASLANGTAGSAYSATMNTASSQGTVSFSLFSGSLPAGLSLATSTGVISGTPTTAGTSSFTIEADDGFSTGNFFDRASYTITVAPAPTPTPTPAPSSGGGGGGYTTYNSLVLSTTPAVKPTPTPVTSPSSLPFSGANVSSPSTPGLPSSFPSNTLVLDHGTIYLIIGNVRLGFTSWKALVGLGYSRWPIVQGDASSYQNSALLLSDPKQTHPPGSWLLSHRTVYYISASGLIGVPSWNVFLSNGGKASLLLPANAADLAQPRLSPVLESHDARVTE
jgi:hypothetical protein